MLDIAQEESDSMQLMPEPQSPLQEIALARAGLSA